MPLEESFDSEQPNWNEFYHGPELAAVIEKLDACLLAVEKKHQPYFDSLTAQAQDEPRPLRLRNFITESWGNGLFQFGINSCFYGGINHELRKDIADECLACIESLKK